MSGIRKGMWVRYKGKTGIVAAKDDATAELHLVNELGETALVIPAIALASLKQAKLADIPASRRPDARRASRLGYEAD